MQRAVIQDSDEGAVLTIHVQPKAGRTHYAGLHGDALKFRVAAPPADGAANQALCEHLAQMFGLAKGQVVIRSGQASRLKRVLLKRVPASRVKQVLNIPP